ncbi:hypothetical protein [Salegentibacter salarius]|uniref:Uncharacterized protein n=1 Tax=Salegentibacter salarius TaxID=435906 RepID=A0A2N0U549_9FLAO|nr:hypothetical protein [Salegentibacter salarius]OEY73933.1 hypothetical protein BHS39_00470 [Salegentibacter salarius]PKD22133.1 hypothetical protein APR40_00470 [Salegentibacter salarius]SLJ86352.1 hypothetical protein SAMN05660445_00158 [Salegentibacter salarius]
MKAKLFFLLIMGFLVTSCSVDPIEEEINFQKIDLITEEVGCAGPDNSKTITLSEAEAVPSWDEVRKLYLSLLAPGIARNGTFDPSIWNIIDAFNDAEEPLGEYITTYSLEGDCADSVELTIIIIPDPILEDPCEDFSAGEDNSKIISYSEAAGIESWDEVRKLYLNLLEPGIARNGEFDPTIWNLIDAFNDAENPLGDYTTTYTVTEGECSDSVELTITVVADEQQQPNCDDVNAGPENMKEMSVSEAAAVPSWDEVRKLYLNLLAPGVPRDGSFDPSIWDIINAFNETDNPVGDYTTIYTITDGQCTDSVELTIRVVPD